MSSIDQRVVQVQFDNKQFEVAIAQSRDSLGRFTKGLQVTGMTKGLEDVNAAAKKVSFDGLANGVDAVANKFKSMSVVGIAAIASLTSKVVDAGIEMVKKFTIEPIIDGFHNYETQINAVQVILANTARYGTKLPDVTKALGELNTYANQTVYNFSEMTDNIGRFTADGVNLKDAVSSIKGIANLAAMSGATTQQASTGMYQLSQAIAAGVVHLQDWNSVVNAGFGGKAFQTALVDTARVSGVSIDKIIAKAGSFRNSLQKGWLSSGILVKTLSQFTGDLSLKQIEAMGFTLKQSQAIQAQARLAVDSATKIKTFSQMTQALKEEVGTAYASIFMTLFGDINQATALFSNAHNVLENALTGPIYALNTLLQDWSALGGRTVLINALKDAFHELAAIMHTITGAWREIFPATTGKELYDLTVKFKDFVDKFKMGGQTADEFKRTFAGVFAVLKIGIDIILAVAHTIGGLIGQATQGSGSILKFTASIGDWLVKLKDSVEKGKAFANFFANLDKYLAVPIRLIREFAGYLGSLFNSKTTKGLSDVAAKLTPFQKLGQLANEAWSKLLSLFGGSSKIIDPIIKKMGDFFKKLVDTIKQGLSSLNFQDVLNTINTGLFAVLVLSLKKLLDKFRGNAVNPLTGFLNTIQKTFKSLTETLEGMQKTLKAATLLEIAVAIGILTVSILVLSKIDAAGLLRASAAITAMFVQLMSSLVIFDKFVTGAGWAKLPFLMGSLILLAAAIDILVIAVKQLATMSWQQLSKGMSGLTVMLAEILGFMKLMQPAGMITAGLGMIALATGVRILVGAVTALSGLSWTQLGKGLAGVAGLLASLALFSKFAVASGTGVLAGAGIILLAYGIGILADVLKKFAAFSWTQIGKGLATLAGSLIAIGAALTLIPPTSVLSAVAILIVAASLGMIAKALDQMGKQSWMQVAKGLVSLAVALGAIAAALILIPPTSLLSAAAILVVAASLGMIADALIKMGGMSWGAIAKSLVELAVSLGIIAVAMILMTEALPGALALVVVAGALMLLLPVLQAFGSMSWGDIAKSLVMLAGVFVILGLAGVALAAVTPVLLALGAAILLLGVGVLAAGAGIFLFAAALTALSIAGAAGGAALVSIVKSMLSLLPTVAKELGLAVIVFAQTIAAAAPAVVNAIVVVISALIDGIVKLTPKVVDAILHLLSMLLDALNKYVPHIIDAGVKLIDAILEGIARAIPGILKAAADIIISFLDGIGKQIPRVIQAGVDLIVNFINSLASAIRSGSPRVGAAGGNLASAIIEGMVSGLESGLGPVISAAENIAKSAINAAQSVLKINSPSKEFIKIGQSVNEGFYKGLTSGNSVLVDKAFQSLRDQLANTINANDHQMTALEQKLNNLERARHKNYAAIAATRAELSTLIAEHKKEVAAYNEVNAGLTKQHAALDAIDKKYADVTARLNTANQTLAAAIKTRDDYNKQITDAYNKDPQFTASQTLAEYEAGLSSQIEKTKEFANVMQTLRRDGLGDAAYKELLSEGIAALPMAQQLLAAGKNGVNQINSQYAALDQAAAALGKSASADLYQAAVDSAQGLVDGLKKQQAALEKQMEILADAMVNAIKKKLGIRSPSKVFAEVGGFSAQGLAQGLDEMSGIVEKSAAGVGNTAIAALTKSLKGISSIVTDNMDISPTITPVLDLSSVKKTAGTLGDMLIPKPITVTDAYSKALIASSGYMSTASAIAAATAQNSPVTQTKAAPPITLNQYNNSPAALSPADIYRQTKNQLSQLRGVLVYQNGGTQP